MNGQGNTIKSKKPADPTLTTSSGRPLRPYLAPTMVFVLAAIVASMIVWGSEQNRRQLERSRVLDIAGDYAHTIQANIERALSATYSLAAMVRQGKGSLPDFDAVAREMLPFYPGAASLQLAPGGIVRRIVPLAGNEGAIGHNLLKDPARTKEAFLARDTGKLTLAGPFNLVQGGVGAAGRLPVFLGNGKGKTVFWGFTIVLIRFPDALDPARLSSLENQGFQYELWRIHPYTGKRQVIAASSQTPLVNPVECPLEVPNGTWTLSVAPVNGWGDPIGFTLKGALGLTFCLLLFVLTHSLINTNINATKIANKLTADLRESEMRYRSLIQKVQTAIVLHDGQGRILDSNPLARELLGLSRDQLLGRELIDPAWHFLREDGSVLPVAEYPASLVLATRQPLRGAVRGISRPDQDKVAWVLVNAEPEYDEAGGIARVIVSFVEITERKRAEEERQVNLKFFESMDQINRAIQGTNDIEQMMSDVLDTMLSIFGCDRAFLAVPCDPTMSEFKISIERTTPLYPGAFARGETVPMSPAVKRLFQELLSNPAPNEIYIGKGLDPDDVVWKTYEIKSQLAIAIYPKVGPPWECGLHQCSYNRVWTPQEKKLFLEISRRLADGLTSLLSYRDLKESEAKYRRIVDTTSEGIWMLGADLLTTFINARMAEMIGYSTEEIIGRPQSDFIFADDISDHSRQMENRRRGLTAVYERRFCRKDGETVWTLASATPIFDASHSFLGSFAMFTDITERKQAEEELKFINVLLSTQQETSLDGILAVDEKACILSYNRRFIEMWGLPEKLVEERFDEPVLQFVTAQMADPPSFLRQVQHLYEHRQETSRDELLLADGRVFDRYSAPMFGSDNRYYGRVWYFRDITERKRAEEEKIKLEAQLRQSQKMESIGTLAGGVAHDFNNILTAIIGYGSLLRLRMEEKGGLQTYVDDILGAAERAAHLTQSLLAFSRKQVLSLQPVNLNEIITRISKLLVRLIGENIEFKAILADEAFTVMADSGQMEQVLMNLATNARDAMPDGGMLAIKTERADITEPHGFLQPGSYAVMSVSDTGKGMDEATKEHIFEPFFTTKEVGKGTGLGLSIVYGIIKQHNSEIKVFSEPGKGTTFKIYLKLIEPKAAGEGAAQPPSLVGGQETILFAEDDDFVRKLVKGILEEYGYAVIEAVDGEDAVARFTENKDKVQLLLLDVVMPKKNGREAYEEMRRMRGDVRAIFLSGYIADIIIGKKIVKEGAPFISKPVTPQLLLSTVREVLDK